MPTSLLFAVYGALAVAALCWILSLFTRECSWVDRIWSIVPALYVGWFAWCADFADARLVLMTVLVTAWGARLTFNFARKGGYAPGGEDYRWEVLRKRMSPAMFQLFNFGFIALYQNVLLLLITLPAWAALEHGAGTPLNAIDVVAALLFLAFLAGETIADEQQWRFHQDKHARKARGERVEHEFLTNGLFRFSRHPNFFCEQGMWWAIYLFSVAAGAGWANWTIVGAVLLSLLFQGSTTFTEQITVSKYPAYREYQKTTSRLLPMPPRA
ncbi:DUF1295 domain-containing protein [Sandaracinus amylolyticus]|uniref:Steroid 5-alpha reductase C-terminal domain-containing protein n=1 Tax=Sandaracinus amylolyticus TaxID=927083 RepID=A0A0F6SD69_9BACT|nr:DUF1295 domain-containing protein [Sandaracinus amylolyticus]AKF02924.1 Hypothetical protein DB32_000072 [Sandaracinus amylolyticus]